MARGPGYDGDGEVLSTLAPRQPRTNGAAPAVPAPAADDIITQRLIELASRMTAPPGEQRSTGAEPVAADPTWGAPIAFGDTRRQAALAARIVDLASGDPPGRHLIQLPTSPSTLGQPSAPKPPHVNGVADALPAPAADQSRPQQAPRLAEMIVEQRQILDRLDTALATLSQEASPSAPMAAPAAQPAAQTSAYDLLTGGRQAQAGGSGSLQISPAIGGPLGTQPSPQPSPRRPAPDPLSARETWLERIFADGLPGFIAGILTSVAIGVALYIMLRRL